MTPPRKGRDPAGGGGQHAGRGPAAGGRAPAGSARRGAGRTRRRAAPPPNALFAEMLRAARELLAVRSPLDAELMVSELLGTWWAQDGGRGGPRRRAEIDALIGEGLIGYAGQQGSPAALALLSGIAALGTPGQAVLAEQAALKLMDRGVARPDWAEHVGAVEAGDCYLNADRFGDRDEVVCVFSYAGQEQHALVVVVDYNAGGLARDGWVTSQVAKLLEYCQVPGGRCAPIDPADARQVLTAAMAATEAAADPPVSESFPSYHAFIRARARTLPPGTAAAPSGPVPPGAAAALPGRREPWPPDRRAALAAAFLASDEAEGLSDRGAASRCVDHIVGYGCDQDFGRPLRVSPARTETFLLDWVPRKVVLSAAEQEAMGHVLLAWTRWAGARTGLEPAALSETLDGVFDAMRAFPSVYKDPASLGVEPDLVARLLPDGDLAALARRVFAFPLLRGTYGGTDLTALRPERAADRRPLLTADHEDAGHELTGEHLDRHVALADRLWRDDPPELWQAAQRLLDRGTARHDAQHQLITVISAAGPAEGDIATALADLGVTEP